MDCRRIVDQIAGVVVEGRVDGSDGGLACADIQSAGLAGQDRGSLQSSIECVEAGVDGIQLFLDRRPIPGGVPGV